MLEHRSDWGQPREKSAKGSMPATCGANAAGNNLLIIHLTATCGLAWEVAWPFGSDRQCVCLCENKCYHMGSSQDPLVAMGKATRMFCSLQEKICSRYQADKSQFI